MIKIGHRLWSQYNQYVTLNSVANGMSSAREPAETKFDIAISGGGPFALYSAFLLLREGKSVAIVSDRDIELKTKDPREKEMAFSRGQRIFLDAENRQHLLDLFPSFNYEELSTEDQNFFKILEKDTTIKVRHIENFLFRRILEEKAKNSEKVGIFNRQQFKAVDMENGVVTLENVKPKPKKQKVKQEQQEIKEQNEPEKKEEKEVKEVKLNFTHVIGADGVKRHCVKKINEDLYNRKGLFAFTYKKIVGPKYFYHASISVNIKAKEGKRELKIPAQFKKTSTKVGDKNYLSGISFNRKKKDSTTIKCVIGGAVPAELYKEIEELQELRALPNVPQKKKSAYDEKMVDLKAHLREVLAPELGVDRDDFEIEIRSSSTKPKSDSVIATRYQKSKDDLSLQAFDMRRLQKADTASYYENGRTALIGSDTYRDPNYQYGHGLNNGLKHARLLAEMLTGEVTPETCDQYSKDVASISTQVERINRVVNYTNKLHRLGDKGLVKAGNARTASVRKTFSKGLRSTNIHRSMMDHAKSAERHHAESKATELDKLNDLIKKILVSLSNISTNPTREDIETFGLQLKLMYQYIFRPFLESKEGAGADQFVPLTAHLLSKLIDYKNKVEIQKYIKALDNIFDMELRQSLSCYFFDFVSEGFLTNLYAGLNYLLAAKTDVVKNVDKSISDVTEALKNIPEYSTRIMKLRILTMFDTNPDGRDIKIAEKFSNCLEKIFATEDSKSTAESYVQFGELVQEILSISASTPEQFKKYFALALSGIGLQEKLNNPIFKWNHAVIKEAIKNELPEPVVDNINLTMLCIDDLMKQNGVCQEKAMEAEAFKNQVKDVQGVLAHKIDPLVKLHSEKSESKSVEQSSDLADELKTGASPLSPPSSRQSSIGSEAKPPKTEVSAKEPSVKPGFLTRYPRVKNALIDAAKGALAGLFVVSIVAIAAALTASTFGLAPALAGGALAIGTALTLSGPPAVALGFTLMGTGIAAGCALLAATLVGPGVRGVAKLFSKKPELKSQKAITPPRESDVTQRSSSENGRLRDMHKAIGPRLAVTVKTTSEPTEAVVANSNKVPDSSLANDNQVTASSDPAPARKLTRKFSSPE